MFSNAYGALNTVFGTVGGGFAVPPSRTTRRPAYGEPGSPDLDVFLPPPADPSKSACFNANVARIQFLRDVHTGKVDRPPGMRLFDVIDETRILQGRIDREDAGELDCPWESRALYNVSQFGEPRGQRFVDKASKSARYRYALEGNWRATIPFPGSLELVQRLAREALSKSTAPTKPTAPSLTRQMPASPVPRWAIYTGAAAVVGLGVLALLAFRR